MLPHLETEAILTVVHPLPLHIRDVFSAAYHLLRVLCYYNQIASKIILYMSADQKRNKTR